MQPQHFEVLVLHEIYWMCDDLRQSLGVRCGITTVQMPAKHFDSFNKKKSQKVIGSSRSPRGSRFMGLLSRRVRVCRPLLRAQIGLPAVLRQVRRGSPNSTWAGGHAEVQDPLRLENTRSPQWRCSSGHCSKSAFPHGRNLK